VPTQPQVASIAHVIQLAVAPVFLLTGVAGMLSVLTNRLSRVIDRARLLEGRLQEERAKQSDLRRELGLLSRRARLINRAISLCTLCALLVCAVIVVLFLGAFLGIEVARPVAVLFIAAMLGLFAGLLSFLKEIYLATRGLRIGPPPEPA